MNPRSGGIRFTDSEYRIRYVLCDFGKSGRISRLSRSNSAVPLESCRPSITRPFAAVDEMVVVNAACRQAKLPERFCTLCQYCFPEASW